MAGQTGNLALSRIFRAGAYIGAVALTVALAMILIKSVLSIESDPPNITPEQFDDWKVIAGLVGAAGLFLAVGIIAALADVARVYLNIRRARGKAPY